MLRDKKTVSSSVYTSKYYLTDCTGYGEFKENFGEKLEPRLKELVRVFDIRPGMKVLDIGCGRGEMVLFAAKRGALAIGIDYSKDAIKLANLMKNKKKKDIKSRMNFYVMNAKRLKFPPSFFDIVILSDVLEHLYAEELNTLFKEIKRVLNKDGCVAIHTAPNKFFIDIFYKFYSYPLSTIVVHLWNTFTASKYPNIAKPAKLRTKSHAIMHVNEPTYFSLKKLFKDNDFVANIKSSNITAKKPSFSIKDIIFNFFVFLHPFSKYFPLNILAGSDFIIVIKNKK